MRKDTTYTRIGAGRWKNGVRSYAIWGIVILAAVASIAGLILSSRQQASEEIVVIPSGAESLPVMSSKLHVPVGSDPGPYNSNPPSSGKMYPDQLLAGFYNEDVPQEYGEYPEGFVVHSLEHGYVVFWYNCDLLSDAECGDLKNEIQGVMGKVDNFKVIGFPWPSIDLPVVITSWGRRLEFEVFDPVRAEQFVRNYLNLAPEPDAG